MAMETGSDGDEGVDADALYSDQKEQAACEQLGESLHLLKWIQVSIIAFLKSFSYDSFLKIYSNWNKIFERTEIVYVALEDLS